ncbi:hypothetical protein B0T18DRAFT_388784 [Schizothecium vesticola]|uniref:Uncharacterized protein n=1 Tax=Schizothecium vesticola TaxID=314040 RepID=A0AA40F0R6_9PEZI|nr:hypothetical protein B0T18DRAFT_388784 [Schizothecium vesticola]
MAKIALRGSRALLPLEYWKGGLDQLGDSGGMGTPSKPVAGGRGACHPTSVHDNGPSNENDDEDISLLDTVDYDQDLDFGDDLELLEHVRVHRIIGVMAESLRSLGYVPDKACVNAVIDQASNIFPDYDTGLGLVAWGVWWFADGLTAWGLMALRFDGLEVGGLVVVVSSASLFDMGFSFNMRFSAGSFSALSSSARCLVFSRHDLPSLFDMEFRHGRRRELRKLVFKICHTDSKDIRQTTPRFSGV